MGCTVVARSRQTHPKTIRPPNKPSVLCNITCGKMFFKLRHDNIEIAKIWNICLFVACCGLRCLALTPATSSSTVFEASTLPSDPALMASVGNGYLATNVFSDTVYVSGVFNGRGNSTPSHRARIPSTGAILACANTTERSTTLYSLDVLAGVFYFRLKLKSFSLEQRIYAHRVYPGLLVTEIAVNSSRKSTLSIILQNNFGSNSKDILFRNISLEFLGSKFGVGNGPDQNMLNKYHAMNGSIVETEEPGSERVGVAVIWNDIPSSLSIRPSSKEQTWYFITAISTSLNAKDYVKDAYMTYLRAIDRPEALLSTHVQAWHDLWDSGKIEVEGNLKLGQAIYGSLYYILSSIRGPDWPFGLSPGGLATDGYNGHTFWDQETWMYPPLLMLYPRLARSCLLYRFYRLTAAEHKAKQYGYQGAMFPWESAFTGWEVCPAEIYSDLENHIVGDIAFAVKQYWVATRDKQWMDSLGSVILQKTAEFWASRVEYDVKKKAYVINDVMPPDEYHYGVNNSVYTNYIAKLNLEQAVKTLPSPPKDWSTIAENIFIPFDSVKKFHPEFEGYKEGAKVKQADVILLGFPLLINMSVEVRENDLRFYETVTDPDGPAMTKAMFSIGWLDIGEEEKAERSFTQGYGNVQEPFKVWTETPGGGAVNFITGAGGFLQSVLFGYGGLKLYENQLHFEPRLLPGTTLVNITGVKYLGNAINFRIDQSVSYVTVTSQKCGSPLLQLIMTQSGIKCKLRVGKTVQVHNTLSVIEPVEDEDKSETTGKDCDEHDTLETNI